MEMKNSIICCRLTFQEIPHKKLGVLRGAFLGFGCPKILLKLTCKGLRIIKSIQFNIER